MFVRLLLFLCVGVLTMWGGYLFHATDDVTRFAGIFISLMCLFGLYLLYDSVLIENHFLKQENPKNSLKENGDFLFVFVGLYIGFGLFLFSLYHAFFEKNAFQSGIVGALAFVVLLISVCFGHRKYSIHKGVKKAQEEIAQESFKNQT